MQGAAVRYVKIEGLHHEFTSIPGCESDFIDLILRLKKLVVKSETIQETKLVLEHKGIGKITAAEIQESADIQIINKDLVLAEMTEDMEFHMEIWVGIGRGYVPSDLQNVEDFPTGVIPIDSIYSPITRVNYSIEKQRVGQRIDYDKIIMEINSDGSIDCRDALYLSAKILRDLYDKLVLFEKEPEYIEEIQMDPELEELEKIFNMNVNELELSVRCSNCLAAAKIDTIGELVSKNENEMLKYRNFGKKSLEEINALLEKYNLGLGYDVDGKSEEIAEARKKVTVR
ncbi:MAG: DNA-directed RNA polymerase subunit alpha [Candidatus Stygibacter frigidus]|nr:DNA-directed RNA polymerase subunit alpha [Candidatus Stygibacter frigidus]